MALHHYHRCDRNLSPLLAIKAFAPQHLQQHPIGLQCTCMSEEALPYHHGLRFEDKSMGTFKALHYGVENI